MMSLQSSDNGLQIIQLDVLLPLLVMPMEPLQWHVCLLLRITNGCRVHMRFLDCSWSVLFPTPQC